MGRWRITPDDVKVRAIDNVISIFNIDPVGFVIPDDAVKDYGDVYVDFDYLDEVVAWAYNLGYENGLKDKGGNRHA